MNFHVHVEVQAHPGIADPQGRTIERALPALGFGGVRDVRVGKVITFDLEADDEATARTVASAMCDRLLVNSVIEQAEVRVGASQAAAT